MPSLDTSPCRYSAPVLISFCMKKSSQPIALLAKRQLPIEQPIRLQHLDAAEVIPEFVSASRKQNDKQPLS